MVVKTVLVRCRIIWFGYGGGNQKEFWPGKELCIYQKGNKSGKPCRKSNHRELWCGKYSKENGFIFFPNHQGMFDALVFLESCPVPFSVVYKKEVSNVILLKQVFRALHAIAIDREDIKQSLQVINQMTEEVKQGRNFLIFPEGTRSRMGNQLLPFKGGTFKSAVRASCPLYHVLWLILTNRLMRSP